MLCIVGICKLSYFALYLVIYLVFLVKIVLKYLKINSLIDRCYQQ